MDGWTDGTIDARKDGRTERRKLYPPQHTSYAGDIMNGYVLYTESTDLFKKKKKLFRSIWVSIELISFVTHVWDRSFPPIETFCSL